MTMKAGVIWADAGGGTRLITPETTGGAAGILAAMGIVTNASISEQWEGNLVVNTPTPAAAAYQTVSPAAYLWFQTASGSILKLAIPSPRISIFLADGVTVDPANSSVILLVAACIANLSGPGGVAGSFLGGRLGAK